MRIIFFNIWHGKVWDKLQKFIVEQQEATDIFCFLEVNPKLLVKLDKHLSDFNNFYYKGVKNVWNLNEGRVFFVNKRLSILETEVINPFNRHRNDTGGFSLIEVGIGSKKLNIVGVHGKTRPGTKLDTPIRLKQSEIIIEKLKDKHPVIIGGDFNLDLNTQSVKMFEDNAYRNLIKDFNIKSTRNWIGWEYFQNQPGFVKQNFADYCFVSRDVEVKNFEVPSIEASDHEPLILDFSI